MSEANSVHASQVANKSNYRECKGDVTKSMMLLTFRIFKNLQGPKLCTVVKLSINKFVRMFYKQLIQISLI